MFNNKRSPVWIDAQPALRTWYASGLGQSIVEELTLHMDTILPRIFGYQGVQVGTLPTRASSSSASHGQAGNTPQQGEDSTDSRRAGAKLVDRDGPRPVNDSSPARGETGKNADPGTELLYRAGIHRKIILDSPGSLAGADSQTNQVGADAISLPIASDVMKLVILPHTLDFCHQPHQALREADRVLTDDGQMVIIGFNPFSQFGLGHLLNGWRDKTPWNGHFFSRGRVTEWLSVLNYRVLDSTCLYLRPPVNRQWVQNSLARVERLQPWMGAVGAVYVLHARKQTVPFTWVRAQRRRQRAGVPVTGYARATNTCRTIHLADHLNQKKND